MSMTPIVAPYVPTYTAHEPYISALEFTTSPTGINVTQLAPGQDATTNAQSLASQIARASAIADSYCLQVLACTKDVLFGGYRVQSGSVLVPVQQVPVVQVNAISIAGTPIAAADAALVTFPAPNIIQIPSSAVTSGLVAVQVEYLAGYPNTFLTADANVGATTLAVKDTLGLIPGSIITISDPAKGDEIVTVASVTATTITLTAATTLQHVKGTNVGAIPPDVKAAVILIMSALIRSRGSEAVVLTSMAGGASTKQAADPMFGTDLIGAMALLNGYKRVA